ncbi:MAG: peptidylprolyl isomerase [Chthoniobacterales bacterium]|nr:peptidylprolyl isomerase [Chthoniobacterales bacterium]
MHQKTTTSKISLFPHPLALQLILPKSLRAILQTVLLLIGSTNLPASPPEAAQTPPLLLLSSQPTSLSLSPYFQVPGVEGPVVRVQTTLGNFLLALYPQAAPRTVENFLSYVRDGAYRNCLVHRSVPGFVIQTGGYRATVPPQPIPTKPPIPNEFRLSNTRGTVAMAKQSGNPDSATNQWFVNLANNSANLDTQNGGFTVFGQVLFDGMQVVDAIAALPTFNAGSPFENLPLRNVQPGQQRVEQRNLIAIQNIQQISLLPSRSSPSSLLTLRLRNLQPLAARANLVASNLTLSAGWPQPGIGALLIDALDTTGNFARQVIFTRSHGTTTPTFWDWDFSAGSQAFTSFFADLPQNYDPELFELIAEERDAPADRGRRQRSLLLGGTNRSDDLWMAWKRQIEGLIPGQAYHFWFGVEFSSDADLSAVGIGGSPGGSVYLKAGASTAEPLVSADAAGWLRLNIDIGSQSQPGAAAAVLGPIGKPDRSPHGFLRLAATNWNTPVTARADSEGRLWVFVGTDSGFEGSTEWYLHRLTIVAAPAESTPPTLYVRSPQRSVSRSAEILIRGLAADPGRILSVEWSSDGGTSWQPASLSAYATPRTDWTATIPLHPGENTLLFRATDFAGNTSPTQERRVTYFP